MCLLVPPDVATHWVTNVVTMHTGEGDSQGAERRLEIPIMDQAPLVLGPPVRGGNWRAGNITDSSPHSRNIEEFDGDPRIPLRFAIDWFLLGRDGDEYSGNFTNNADHHGYGADLLAADDGSIEAVTDGVPENVPGNDRAVPITLDTRGGNLVILDIGDGRYVTYAHLIPGSVKGIEGPGCSVGWRDTVATPPCTRTRTSEKGRITGNMSGRPSQSILSVGTIHLGPTTGMSSCGNVRAACFRCDPGTHWYPRLRRSGSSDSNRRNLLANASSQSFTSPGSSQRSTP